MKKNEKLSFKKRIRNEIEKEILREGERLLKKFNLKK
jgi:hypothetical protein